MRIECPQRLAGRYIGGYSPRPRTTLVDDSIFDQRIANQAFGYWKVGVPKKAQRTYVVRIDLRQRTVLLALWTAAQKRPCIRVGR